MPRILVLFAGFLLIPSESVMAQLPQEITDALSLAKADALAVSGLVLVVLIAIQALRYLHAAVQVRRFERSLGSAAVGSSQSLTRAESQALARGENPWGKS